MLPNRMEIIASFSVITPLWIREPIIEKPTNGEAIYVAIGGKTIGGRFRIFAKGMMYSSILLIKPRSISMKTTKVTDKNVKPILPNLFRDF